MPALRPFNYIICEDFIDKSLAYIPYYYFVYLIIQPVDLYFGNSFCSGSKRHEDEYLQVHLLMKKRLENVFFPSFFRQCRKLYFTRSRFKTQSINQRQSFFIKILTKPQSLAVNIFTKSSILDVSVDYQYAFASRNHSIVTKIKQNSKYSRRYKNVFLSHSGK